MKRIVSIVGVLLASCLAAATAGIQPPRNSGASGGTEAGTDPWAAVRFLAGEWVGEGSGRPGEGGGSFSFHFDLGGSVLVRRDHSEYPASQGRSAAVHDALMVIYPRATRTGLEAIYFDNEGHVIRYEVSAPVGAASVVFVSEPAAGSPRYRLTYEPLGADEVMITFEIAPLGEPPAFKPYIAGRSRRVGR